MFLLAGRNNSAQTFEEFLDIIELDLSNVKLDDKPRLNQILSKRGRSWYKNNERPCLVCSSSSSLIALPKIRTSWLMREAFQGFTIEG